jgi:transcriptional regulator with XRE-family HTH domain
MPDAIDLMIGRRLRRRRRLLGWTQQQLAEACGMRFQRIHKYECAENRLSAATMWRLAQVLGVQPKYYFDVGATSHGVEDEARASASAARLPYPGRALAGEAAGGRLQQACLAEVER